MSVYDYDQTRPRDVMIIVASVQLGISILTMPRAMAEITLTSDGWIPIIAGGLVAMLMGWIIGHVINQNPQQDLLTISKNLLGKWVTRMLFSLLAVVLLIYFAVIIRFTGFLAKLYFFEATPIEAIVLAFVWVIIYCTAGSRIAIMRINLIFLPIILSILMIILIFNLGQFRWENMQPMFATSWEPLLLGSLSSIMRYSAFVIMLFYGFLAKPSPALPRVIVSGIGIVIVVYVLVFIFSVGVLGLHTTIHTLFPTVEMAKEAEVPGGFFERMQSVFFAVWMLAIFTSGVITLDISTMMMQSLFQKVSKITWILWLAPIGYFISMIPDDHEEIFMLNRFAAMSILTICVPYTFALLIAKRMKGKKQNG